MLQVKVQKMSKMSAYAKVAEQNLINAVDATGNLILQRARRFAPKLSGELRDSGRSGRRNKDEVVVEFGGERVRYAKRRHFENKKNPHTLRYLERAGQSVAKEGGVRKFLR